MLASSVSSKQKKEVIWQPNHVLTKMVQVLTTILQVGLETAESTSENLAHVRKLPIYFGAFSTS